MVKIAAGLPEGIVIADNDASGTGERVAKQIGWPYWMSDQVGEDANDTHRRLGLFKFSQSLTRSVVIL
jgi:putative DNA primase/helicase